MTDTYNVLDFGEYPELWRDVYLDGGNGLPNPLFPSLIGGSASGVVDTLILTAYPVYKNITVDSVRYSVVGADALNPITRIGLYSVAASGAAGSLIYSTGDIDVNVTGVIYESLASSVKVAAGNYYIGLGCTTDVAVFRSHNDPASSYAGLGTSRFANEQLSYTLGAAWSELPQDLSAVTPTIEVNRAWAFYNVSV